MSLPVADVSYPHIAVDPDVSGGQPVVVGTRIAVSTLVRAHQLGMDFDEILAQYPSLGPGQLHATFAYYFDHKPTVDRLIEEHMRPIPEATVFEA